MNWKKYGILLLLLASVSFAEQIEDMFSGGFATLVPDSFMLGILVLLFFGTFVILQGTALEVKVLVLIPASLLASLFIPFISVVMALIVGGIIAYLAFSKLVGR